MKGLRGAAAGWCSGMEGLGVEPGGDAERGELAAPGVA